MKKRLIALGLVVSMALGLAACSSSSSATPSSSQAQTEAPEVVEDGTQGVTDTEIIVANSAATSGNYAGVGVPFISAIEGYFKMVNDAGGIDGRQITFIHNDDEFDPNKGKAYLQEYLEDDKVFAIVGHFGTPVVSATIEDLKAAGVPSVYFATGISALYSDEATSNETGFNILPVQPIYVTEGQIMVARLYGTLGATETIGIIYTNDDAGQNMLAGAQKKAAELNITLVEAQVEAGAADVSAAVTTIKDAGVQGVIIGAIQATMPTIAKEMASQGMTVPAITTYVNVAVTIAQQVSEDIAGHFDIYGNDWKDPSIAEDYALFAEYVPDYADNNDAMSGWVAAYTFCEGLRRLEGQDVTWTSYINALASDVIELPFGASVDFTSGKRMGVSAMQLKKIDTDAKAWTVADDFKSMDELVSGK
ncbi:MAG: ABC transporter substrate-binding protein [Lachnospiraceae bacterium]|nr:ABC transporter substrate-binding protein [Lachnospiraceae bacterium]